jgi:hypothetical protein
VRSSRASGIWSPHSRIALEEHATPAFKKTWERMCRVSFQTYQSFLGLPGTPVEFIESYFVEDVGAPATPHDDKRPEFADPRHEMVPDLSLHRTKYLPGEHSLGNRTITGTSLMMFNISALSHQLISDFLAAGGKIAIREFHSPAEFGQLPEPTLINATGYGARALMGDNSIVPVRGQLARTIPEPAIHYGIYYKQMSFLPRRDGLVFQQVGDGDYYGYDDDTTVPDRTEAERAITTVMSLFAPETSA